MKTVRCPICKKKGLHSRVSVGPASLALTEQKDRVYYDEDGNPTNVENYRSNLNYYCSNGHVWTVRS